MSYTAFNDWTGAGVPGFAGNDRLVTNAQINYMQVMGWLQDTVRAPNNNTCPTKSQLSTYTPMITNVGSHFTALASNECVPIGDFSGNS